MNIVSYPHNSVSYFIAWNALLSPIIFCPKYSQQTWGHFTWDARFFFHRKTWIISCICAAFYLFGNSSCILPLFASSFSILYCQPPSDSPRRPSASEMFSFPETLKSKLSAASSRLISCLLGLFCKWCFLVSSLLYECGRFETDTRNQSQKVPEALRRSCLLIITQ